MKKLIELYFVFFRIGLFTFGGGYSMLPMLESEIVERRKWATHEQLLDYFAVSQCTPGIIAVNAATFIGYSERGITGAAFATSGVVMPSFLIILVVASLLQNFENIPEVAHAFAGVRAAVAALILAAVIQLFKNNILCKKKTTEPFGTFVLRSIPPLVICIFAFIGVVFWRLSPVFIAITAAVAGILLRRSQDVS